MVAAAAAAARTDTHLHALAHVLRDGRDRAIDLGHRVVDVRREADTGSIASCSSGATDAIVPVERGGELRDVDVSGPKRDDRTRSRRIRMRPDVHAVDAAESGNQALRERSRSLLLSL